MPFTTSAKVKIHMVISGSTFDTLIAQLITQVDDLISKRTNVPTGATAPAITDEIVDSDGNTRIKVKNHPIASIVKIERRSGINNEWEEYPDETHADVEFEDDVIFPLYVVSGKGERKIQLEYTAGYATAAVPDDLCLAATLLVCHLFNNRNTIGNDSVNVLGLSQTMAKDEYHYVKSILDKYKLVYAL